MDVESRWVRELEREYRIRAPKVGHEQAMAEVKALEWLRESPELESWLQMREVVEPFQEKFEL